jgi:adenylate cyclase
LAPKATSIFHGGGPRTRRLVSFLRDRERKAPAERLAFDCHRWPSLTRPRAVVFTDTADFTVRTARDGILHFLMAFSGVVDALRPVVRARRGTVVKVEGDSMLLSFADPAAACRGTLALEDALRRFNRSRPKNEQFLFSYGIGYGDIVELEGDFFGLEVNLASKLGEDLACPGEILLTPAALSALDAPTRRRVFPYKVLTFKGTKVPIHELKAGRPGR